MVMQYDQHCAGCQRAQGLHSIPGAVIGLPGDWSVSHYAGGEGFLGVARASTALPPWSPSGLNQSGISGARAKPPSFRLWTDWVLEASLPWRPIAASVRGVFLRSSLRNAPTKGAISPSHSRHRPFRNHRRTAQVHARWRVLGGWLANSAAYTVWKGPW